VFPVGQAFRPDVSSFVRLESPTYGLMEHVCQDGKPDLLTIGSGRIGRSRRRSAAGFVTVTGESAAAGTQPHTGERNRPR
jgi:hypothetical protein